jgi:molybdopterin-guanine dinucleotide biosynthesis protein A
VLTALQNATTPTVIIVTLDMPCIRAEHLHWCISQTLARPKCLGLMSRRTRNGEDQIEPFPFTCRREAADAISAHLASGQRSVHHLLGEEGFVAEAAPIDWPISTWTNLNQPEDFQAFLKSIGRSRP